MKRRDSVIKIIHQIFFLSLLFSFSAFAKPSLVNKEASTAMCFISDAQNRVLIVREILSNKLALPGGNVSQYEEAKVVAKRETMEKTGIDVSVNEILIQQGNTVIFACQSKEKIPIYEVSHSLAILPFWQAVSFSFEVQAAYLAKPNLAMSLNSRFSSQASLYTDFLTQNKASEVVEKANFSDLILKMTLFDEKLASKAQHFVQSFPKAIANSIDSFLHASSWFGSLSALFLIIPFALATGGTQRGMQVILGLMIVFTLVTLIKIQFEVPRPLHIFPHLMKNSLPSQFSFPSMHSAVTFFTWILVYLWFQFKDRSTIYICVFPGILTGISRVYLGANYLIDVFIGSMLGVLIAFFTIFIQQKLWLAKPWLWLILGIINLSLALLIFQPIFFYIAVFCLTYTCVLYCFKPQEMDAKHSRFNLFGFVFSLLGMLTLWLVFKSMSNITPVNSLIMLGQSICIILLTIWITVITPRVADIPSH